MEQNPAFRAPDDAVDNYDDVELLVRISDQDRDRADADTAFQMFFERHAEFLRRACVKYRYHHSKLGDEDVVMLVMNAVYRGEAVFSPPARASAETVRRVLRGWLISVARNQFAGEMRKLRFDDNLVAFEDGTDAPVTPRLFGDAHDNDEQPGPDPEDRNKVLRFRETLKPEDKIILDRSMPYYDRLTGDFNVPPEEARAIAAEVGRNVPAVRQRRRRLMAAMKAWLSD